MTYTGKSKIKIIKRVDERRATMNTPAKQINSLIGEYCKEVRISKLSLNLKEFSTITGFNYKNLHAFENGLANNLIYPFLYLVGLQNNEDRKEFLLGLQDIIKEVELYD